VKVGVPEFDADRLAKVALAHKIFAHPLTEFQQDLGEGFPVESRMEIALEGRLAAHRLRYPLRDDPAFVAAVRDIH